MKVHVNEYFNARARLLEAVIATYSAEPDRLAEIWEAVQAILDSKVVLYGPSPIDPVRDLKSVTGKVL